MSVEKSVDPDHMPDYLNLHCYQKGYRILKMYAHKVHIQ